MEQAAAGHRGPDDVPRLDRDRGQERRRVRRDLRQPWPAGLRHRLAVDLHEDPPGRLHTAGRRGHCQRRRGAGAHEDSRLGGPAMIDPGAFVDALTARGYGAFAGVPCSYLKGVFTVLERTGCYTAAPHEGIALALSAGHELAGRPAVVFL